MEDYIGCRKGIFINRNPILNQEMLKKYYYYLSERHSIYKKKEAGEKFPWTEDYILKTNSFTCCKRRLDRTTKYLYSHVINNAGLPFSEKVWRCILFRLYNNIETMSLIGIDDIFMWKKLQENMDKIDSIDHDPFSRAYKIIAIKYAYRNQTPNSPNWKSSLFYYICTLHDDYEGEVPKEVLSEDPMDCINWLKDNIIGVGDFMAYQIWVDLSYIGGFPGNDNNFTMAGPGCIAGIDMLCEDLNGLTYEEFLFWLRDHIEDILKDLDPEYSSEKFFDTMPYGQRYWNLQDLENSFCEFSKYIYLSKGRHKRVRKYIPKD